MPVINSVAHMKDEVAGWRHELHKNPQTAYEEKFASAFIATKLDEWGIPYKKGIAVTGIVATIEGKSTASGKSIALRADIDALDIVEENDIPYASQTPGKMHACGHDGHTATLLGVAKHLKENNNFDGTVYLFFQPAEEGGGGAYRMIEEGLFEDFPADAVYGLHNWPGLEMGQIATRRGPLMASADEFNITIHGKGGHAAMPHLTIDPIVVGSQIVTALQSIVSRNVNPVDQAVITVSNFNGGTGAHNIIPDTVKMVGTIRAFKQDTRMSVRERIKTIVGNIALAHGATADIEIMDGYDPTVNSENEVDLAVAVAREIVGENNVDDNVEPTMGAEDFGAYLMQKPGAFIFVGQGTKDPHSRHNQGLHTPGYDFNDDILPIGISWFTRLVETSMPLK